jgi:hypothetical protein
MKANYDMTGAKRSAVLSPAGKTRISIYLDDAILEAFRRRAEQEGKGYQTLINEALAASLALNNAPVTIGTPMRIQRGDGLSAKLAELDISEQDIADALAWARQGASGKPERKK